MLGIYLGLDVFIFITLQSYCANRLLGEAGCLDRIEASAAAVHCFTTVRFSCMKDITCGTQ